MKHKLLLLIPVILVLLAVPTLAVVNDSLAFWCMNNETYTYNNPLYDCSSNNYNLTSLLPPTYTEDAISGYYSFDGGDDYLRAPSAMLPNSGNFSINGWFYLDSAGFGASNVFVAQYQIVPRFHMRTDNADDHMEVYIDTELPIDFDYTPYADAWQCITLTRNGTLFSMYINNTLIDSGNSAKLIQVTHPTNIGAQTVNGVDFVNTFDGYMDNVAIYLKVLDKTDRDELCNVSTRYDPYFIATVDTGTVDIIVYNSSGVDENNLSSGENFNVAANWTNSTGVAINNSTGYCELTLEDGITETDSSVIGNVTICNNVLCNYTRTFTETFYNQTITNLAHYDAHFNVCYDQTQGNENVTVNVQCASGSTSTQIAPSQIPLCSDSTLFFIAEGDGTCNGDENVTINITSLDDYADRIRVTDLELDNVYNTLTVNMTYNATSALWTAGSYEYYDTGSYDVNVSCIDTATGGLNASASEQVNVFGGAPAIYFNTVITACGTTTLTPSVDLEYCDGVFTWTGSIVDNDPDTLNVYWYNSTNDVIHSHVGVDPLTETLDTPDELFLDFANPYIISVWVNDSEGNEAEENLTFTVNDTTLPSVSIISPNNASNVFGDNSINFQGLCTDQALYRFNATVTAITGGATLYSYEKSGIEDTLWYHNATVNITGLTASVNDTDWELKVNLTCADAHTGEDLKILRHPAIQSRTFSFTDADVGFLEIEVRTAGAQNFNFERLQDRYVFTYDTILETDEIEYTIKADSIDCVGDLYGYPAHCIINERFWFDGVESASTITNYDTATQKVDPDGQEAEITIYLEEAKTSFRTESLGELNIISEVYYLSNYDATADEADFTSAGIICGEKYPNNFFELNFNASGWTNCTLKVNDYLYEGWSSDCGAINITTNIGRQHLVLTGTSSLNNTVSDDCNFWNDKTDKELGDFMFLIIMIGSIIALVAMGFIYGIFMVFAGVLAIFLGYDLFAYHWLLGGVVIVIGIVLILWEVINSK